MSNRPMGTTFADLLGKLTVVRVECSKCGRFGRYPLHRLIDQHGGNGTILEWLEKLTADCHRCVAWEIVAYSCKNLNWTKGK